MVFVLLAGGVVCAEPISSVLDHAMDVLEALSAASPRKSRRELRSLLDRAESVVEMVDTHWFDGLNRGGHDEMAHLGSLLVSVHALSSISDGVPDVVVGLLGYRPQSYKAKPQRLARNKAPLGNALRPCQNATVGQITKCH
jgi:hypothetical protein